MDKSLRIYKVTYNQEDNQILDTELDYSLTSYRLSATRMGTAPTISGIIKYVSPIEISSDDRIYVLFKGDRYYLDNISNTSYEQSTYTYSCNVSFTHERKILETVHFFDVPLASDSDLLPVVFNSDFSFAGDIKDLANRLNLSLEYSKLDNYIVYVDDEVKSESGVFSATKLKLLDALKQGYETYKVPFFFNRRKLKCGVMIFSGPITSISERAFFNASIKKVNVPNSVTSIGNKAFQGCKVLTDITIPDSVTTIGEWAFYGCNDLASVTIGNSTTTIGNNAFARCRILTSVYCKPTTPPAGGTSMFSNNASDRKIYVPMESVEAYKSASGWSGYADAISGYDYSNYNDDVNIKNNEIVYEADEKLVITDSAITTSVSLMRHVYDYYRIVFGESAKTIDSTLKLGLDGNIISVNDNSKIKNKITKITGVGSTQNIPYYYPNPTPKGFISIGGDSKGKYEIVNLLKFCNTIGVGEELIAHKNTVEFGSVDLNIQNGVIEGNDYYVRANGSISFAKGIDPNKTYLIKAVIAQKFHISFTKSTIALHITEGVVSNAYVTIKAGGVEIIRTDVIYEGGEFILPDSLSVTYHKNVDYTTEISFYASSIKPGTRIGPIVWSGNLATSIENFLLIDYSARQTQIFDDIAVNINGADYNELEIIPTLYITRIGLNISKYITDAFLYHTENENNSTHIGLYKQVGFTTDEENISFGRIGKGEYKLSLTVSYLPEEIVTSETAPLELIAGNEMYWMSENKTYRIDNIGISIKDGETSETGDIITQTIENRLPVSKNLLPYRYRESNWSDIWYSTDDKGTSYIPFDGREIEHIYEDEGIKPSIKDTRQFTNVFTNYLDQPLEVAFDDDDNDEVYPEDSDKAGKYKHPYFFIKLRRLINQTKIFPGPTTRINWEFNLFDSVLDGQEASISFTTGHVAGCTFNIAMDEDTGTFNPVQVDSDGNLVRDELGNVIVHGTKIESQQDTSSGAVWIALRKDINTMGTIMPSKKNNIFPTTDDKFVLLGIDMPEALMINAEKELENKIKEHLRTENSVERDFSVKASSIYAEENDDFYLDLDENVQVSLEFNGETHEGLYVSSYNVSMNNNNALPEIELHLTDEISVTESSKAKTLKTLNSLSSNIYTLNKDVGAITAKDPLKIKPV